MVILGKWQQKTLTISHKPNSITISIQSDGGSEVYSFDRVGRLWTAIVNGISYRRGLDGKVVAKWSTGNSKGLTPSAMSIPHERQWLAQDDAEGLLNRANLTASTLLSDIKASRVSLSQPLTPSEILDIEAIIGFGVERARADTELFRQVYKPVGILPPDQYMAVVLQMTEGCSFNACTFCNFYRDRPFQIKNNEVFRKHCQDVNAYLGSGMRLRRTIFLGDANALVVPMPRLLPLIDVVHEVFDVEALGGIYAFLDGFSGQKKTMDDYTQLVKRGFKRVYIGMESGSERLLSFLNKPGKPQDVVDAVRAMKAAHLPVGIIVLLGAGGKAYAAEHVRDTIKAINKMGLDMDDLIYFSELVESEGLPYVQAAYKEKLLPLSSEERTLQGEQIEEGLVFSQRGGTPHISRYDIREFVY